MPLLTGEDVRRAYELYGPPVGFVRGKTTRRQARFAVLDDDLILDQKKQVLSADVIHLDSYKYLVSVSEPLQLTLQTPVAHESQMVQGMALQSQLEVYRSRGFQAVRVYVDPQSTFQSLTTKYPGIVIDPSGAGDHVLKVDAKIRRLKEVYRGVKEDLPRKLPLVLAKDLVASCVARQNVQFTSAINQHVVPKVLFTGLKVDFKKELSLAFGNYCEVYAGTNNTSSGRTAPCLTLHPCNNATGSWTFYNLRTHARICKSQCTKMVTTQLIVDAVNTLDAKSPPTVLDVIQPVGDETEATPPSSIPVSVPEAGPEQPVGDVLPDSAPEPVEASGVAPNEDPAPEAQDAGDEPPELVAAGGDDSDDEAEESDDEDDEDDKDEDGGMRRSARIAAGVQPPAHYTKVTRLHQCSHNDVRRDEGIKKAEIEEVLMCFVTLGALLPVLKSELEGAVALSCHMFTIEKFLANEEHDKFKTRIVAHGNE
jgi:hypothetical protein